MKYGRKNQLQIKKDEVKKRLLDAASRQFIKKGFRGTSIRTIVKQAGTTIGNFYNYFDGKEAVFCELTEETYLKFKYLIDSHRTMDYEEKLIKSNNMDVWRDKIFKLFTPLFEVSDESFLLLFENSEGTKYQDAKDDIINFLSEHFMEHIMQVNPEYKYTQMSKIIARQLIAAVIEILKITEDEDMKKQLIVEEVLFCGLGVMGILKGEINDWY